MTNNNDSVVVASASVTESNNVNEARMIALLSEAFTKMNEKFDKLIELEIANSGKLDVVIEQTKKSARTSSRSERTTLPPPNLVVVGTENQNIEEAIKASLTKKHKGCNIYVDVSQSYVEITYPVGCKFLEITRLRYCSDILSLFYVGEMPTKKTLEWYRYCSEVIIDGTGQYKTVFCMNENNN